MKRGAIPVRLKPKERAALGARLRAAIIGQRLLLRIKVVLEAVEGTSTHEIGRELDPTATKAHIDAFVETDNMDAEPFVQTKSKVHRRRIKWPRLSDL